VVLVLPAIFYDALQPLVISLNNFFIFAVFRPVIDPIASIFHRMLCWGRSDASNDAQGYTLGGEPLPGSDPIEASRRR